MYTVNQIYDAGREAFLKGKTLADCPFKEVRAHQKLWSCGWTQERNDDLDIRNMPHLIGRVKKS